MSTSRKAPQTDRHHGGPGSSHQDATEPQRPERHDPQPGSPTNGATSHVSGGGGERDAHHRHSKTGQAPDRTERSH
ncbi:hypothetical protein [Methylobacterium sp. WSM2598]|uniref:hypothetical protein n=1 Tax=Methylobacterium sp. WSM2598 TaxID=398261 RepID=UPI00037545BF|nr:hypothetical protein [Methylobacterium sp. WSM2598]